MNCKNCNLPIQSIKLEKTRLCRDCYTTAFISPLQRKVCSAQLALANLQNELVSAKMALTADSDKGVTKYICACGASFSNLVDIVEHIHMKKRFGSTSHRIVAENHDGKLTRVDCEKHGSPASRESIILTYEEV